MAGVRGFGTNGLRGLTVLAIRFTIVFGDLYLSLIIIPVCFMVEATTEAITTVEPILTTEADQTERAVFDERTEVTIRRQAVPETEQSTADRNAEAEPATAE